MNNYTLRYTIWNREGKPNPQHKILTFDSENDLLAAADEGMCQVFDDNPDKEMLFRAIELNNAKAVYEEMTNAEHQSV